MQKQLEVIAKSVRPILRKNGVIRAGIFGSVARGTARKRSDIDILIRFKGRKSLLDLVRLKHQLENKLKKKVDLVEYETIKPLVKKEILADEVKIL